MTPAERYKPVQFKVLVQPDTVDEFYDKKGLIIVPDTVAGKKQLQQDKATVLAVGGNAFVDWEEPIPKVGDRVLMARHSGYMFRDPTDRNKEYRVVNDADITLILKGDVTNEYA